MTPAEQATKPSRKIIHAAIGAAGAAGVAALAGKGPLAAILGAAVGAALVILTDKALGVRRQLQRLAEVEQELKHERERVRQVLEVTQQQVEAAKREAAVAEAWSKVWGGAYNETLKTGQLVPLQALMNRAELEMQVRGIVPVPAQPRGGPNQQSQ